jgi:hypothetical protein
VSIRLVSIHFVEYMFMNSICFVSIGLVSIRFVEYTFCEYTFCKCIKHLIKKAGYNMKLSHEKCVRFSYVNVHKPNLLLRPNFQFVSIWKQNVLVYPYITVIKMKIKTNSFKNHKKITKTKQNEKYFRV